MVNEKPPTRCIPVEFWNSWRYREKIPKVSRQRKRLRKRAENPYGLRRPHSSFRSQKTKLPCFRPLRELYTQSGRQLKAGQSRYYPNVPGLRNVPSQVSFSRKLPKTVLHQHEGIMENKDMPGSGNQRPGCQLSRQCHWEQGTRGDGRWPLHGSVRVLFLIALSYTASSSKIALWFNMAAPAPAIKSTF